ncbi:MAG TPA: hypothetical protein ENL17_02045 [Candidatus Methanoperedenaceae archaeon]|nr:hypothetical protein [Candidatus Methanoperedenaceae archaeon]
MQKKDWKVYRGEKNMGDDEIMEDERYSRVGEAYIVRRLAKTIADELGEETAEKIMYNAGRSLGEDFAAKKGGVYDPAEALAILRAHTVRSDSYSIDMVDGYVGKDENFVAIVKIENCVVQRIIGQEFKKRPLLCRFSRGYIEGALSKLTGLDVKERVFKSENEPFPTCHGRITFSKRKE